MKDIIINQPAGLGDILFCQKIAHVYKLNGYNVIWPVSDQYLDAVKEHVISDATFISTNAGLLDDPFIPRVNLHTADQHFSGCMMDAKYKLTSIDWSDWREYLNISYNSKRMWKLFEMLCLDDSTQRYSVVNRWFGTPPHSQSCAHIPQVPGKVIEMSPIDGYTIFDWAYILNHAAEIHTVDTSLMFIIEKLGFPDEHHPQLYCYSRFNPPDFRNVTHLFKKPWMYQQ